MKFSICSICPRHHSLVVSGRQLLGEASEESVVEQVLHLTPVRPRLPLLQPPVVEEEVVEDREGVARHEHLVALGVPRHPEPDEPLIKDRGLGSGHIDWLVFEQIFCDIECDLCLVLGRQGLPSYKVNQTRVDRNKPRNLKFRLWFINFGLLLWTGAQWATLAFWGVANFLKA